MVVTNMNSLDLVTQRLGQTRLSKTACLVQHQHEFWVNTMNTEMLEEVHATVFAVVYYRDPLYVCSMSRWSCRECH